VIRGDKFDLDKGKAVRLSFVVLLCRETPGRWEKAQKAGPRAGNVAVGAQPVGKVRERI
jgi:hypothetical protein